MAAVIAQMSPASQGGSTSQTPSYSWLLAEDDLKPFRSRLVRFIDKQIPYCFELVKKREGITCRAKNSLHLCKDLHKRRNWIHIGSEEAGPRVAAIVSIVETCRRLKIPIRDYLCSILPGLADFPIKRIAEFTPGARAARN
jgi:hypothetical protein